MNVHTSLALAFVHATAKEISQAREGSVRPHWVALRVADRVDRSDRVGTVAVPSTHCNVSRKTREKIQREQRILV